MLDRRKLFGHLGLSALGLSLPWSSRGVMASPLVTAAKVDPDKPLRRIAFGSCNKSDRPQDHFAEILKSEPDLWVWLGDIIYGDGTDLDGRLAKYQTVKTNLDYQALRGAVPIIGCWDDHDYASDNQNYDVEYKDQSQQLLLDFLDRPSDHPSRFRPGVYMSETFGPLGQRVKIILLDVRYFKDDPDFGQGLLGELQWSWLLDELEHDADLLIIGSGLNFTSRIAGFGLEGWCKYQNDQRRLLEVLGEQEVPVLLLSGDRHMADISRHRLASGLHMYEFMSSGLTHSVNITIPNHDRVGRPVGSKNVGLIDIDWTSTGPVLRLSICDPLNIDRQFTSVVTSF